MYYLLTIMLCLLLTGCGTLKLEKTAPVKKEEPIGVQILEKNKEELTVIKNKTADDIELGYKTRTLEKKIESNEEFGKKVRAVVEEQLLESKKEIKKINPTVLTIPQCQDVNTRLNILIICILLLNVLEVTFLIYATFNGDKKREKQNPKCAGKCSNQTSNN